MDDPDITIEEYVQLETERALRNGKVYKLKTATYGKIWYDEDVHCLGFVETEFPAIVYNDALTSKLDFSSKPTRCFFLDHTVHQPCVLSEAHLAYFLSLENGGVSLHRFIDVHSHAPPVHSSSPVLNLPQTRKGHAPVDHHDNEGGVLSIWIWDFLVDVLLLFMNGKDEQTVEKHLIAKLFTPVHEEIEGYESSLNDKEDASFLYMQVNASTCDELDDFEEFRAIYDDGDVDEF
ncbi:hypothetical protein Tco_0699563, partial [Tanacetum coccineum]